ncbi:MAG: flavodoxin family protein [Firmicutes bacterium]|nr:flavodoxin family protein [Bacillota bacterium]
MKVLIINGSPRADGNTARAIAEMKKIFDAEGVETDVMQVGNKAIRGCIGCRRCADLGRCVFDDEVNVAAEKLKAADGLVIASPVYYANPNGTLVSFLDRLFFSRNFDVTMKVAASVAIARRGGAASTFDALNKFITYGGFAVATSQYWNIAYGREAGEVEKDEEGMLIMRTLAKNMVFMMKSIALGKEKYGLPEKEPGVWTHFIR